MNRIITQLKNESLCDAEIQHERIVNDLVQHPINGRDDDMVVII